MKTTKKTFQLYKELVTSILKQPFSEEDALVWMILFHTHQICLQNSTNGTQGTDHLETRLAPLTQRAAGEVIAHFWPDRSDKRANYYYWYWLYNTKTPFEDLSQVPPNLLTRLNQFRNLLAKDPQVRAVVEDD